MISTVDGVDWVLVKAAFCSGFLGAELCVLWLEGVQGGELGGLGCIGFVQLNCTA